MSEEAPDTTSQLIERIKNGEHSAFNEFFKTHYPEIYGFVYRSTFNKMISEEIAQETFVNFWEAREKLSPDSFPKAYLFRISKNLLINSFERTKKMYSLYDGQFDNTLQDEGLNENLIEQDLKKAILELPERCRLIFILNRYHNFRYSEIAQMLDISVQTVKNQMSKSIKILRDYLNS